MSVQKEPAACSIRSGEQTASNIQLNKPYRKLAPMSSLKSEIGTLLLCLQLPVGPELSQIGWGLFERRLRRYVGLRISQHGRQSVDTATEATNATQRVSG